MSNMKVLVWLPTDGTGRLNVFGPPWRKAIPFPPIQGVDFSRVQSRLIAERFTSRV